MYVSQWLLTAPPCIMMLSLSVGDRTAAIAARFKRCNGPLQQGGNCLMHDDAHGKDSTSH